MNILSRYVLVTAGLAFMLFAPPTVHAELVSTERDDVFKAAGFSKAPDGRYIRCEEETPTLSYMPGQIELADLNGDGQPEAWVTESSAFCYGHTGKHFALVLKDKDGWRVLIENEGDPAVLETRHHGWPDIGVYSPLFVKEPVYHWNGAAYVLSGKPVYR